MRIEDSEFFVSNVLDMRKQGESEEKTTGPKTILIPCAFSVLISL